MSDVVRTEDERLAQSVTGFLEHTEKHGLLGAAKLQALTEVKSMTDEQIKHMVNRFLGWRLPEHFTPDDGISFTAEYNVEYNAARGKPPARHQPSGTNLFDAGQAEAMVRYMVEGMPRG